MTRKKRVKIASKKRCAFLIIQLLTGTSSVNAAEENTRSSVASENNSIDAAYAKCYVERVAVLASKHAPPAHKFNATFYNGCKVL